MITHLRALQAVTETLWPTYLFRAPLKSPVQYLVWQSPAWASSDEIPVCVEDSTLDVPVRLLARAELGDAVVIMLQRAHDLLAPSTAPAALAVDGRHATVTWERSEFVAVDTDVTITDTNTHPSYGIDTYRLISQGV